MSKHVLCYLLIVSLIKVGMITHGWRTSLLLLVTFTFVSLNTGLWRRVHPVTCEWAWLICIYKCIVGTTIFFYLCVCVCVCVCGGRTSLSTRSMSERWNVRGRLEESRLQVSLSS